MKFRLLLVDANIIIELFRLGIWDTVIARCDVHLSETILKESHFFEDDMGIEQPIRLAPYQDSGQITVHAVDGSRLTMLRRRLGATLLEKMDAGEAELLCILDDAPHGAPYHICSADAVVYRYLGATYHTEQGISLEEVLSSIGITIRLQYQYSHKFREKFSQSGFQLGWMGQGLRPS